MRDIILCLALLVLGLTLSRPIGGTKYFLCKPRPIHNNPGSFRMKMRIRAVAEN